MNPRGIRRFRQLRAIFKSLKAGVSIAQSCKAANIDASTLWMWRQANHRLNDKIHNVIDSRIQMVEDALFNAAIKGNVKAIEDFLFNRSPLRWKNNSAINNTIFMQQNSKKDEEEGQNLRFKDVPRVTFTD